ncbi:MAG: chemotaxis protein CheB [Candidatus Krumholzibacteriia bacterium]
MSESKRVFALLSDARLRQRIRRQWRSNGITLCGVHAEGGEALVGELARLRPHVVIADADADGVREIVQAASQRYRIPVIGVVRAQQSGLAALLPLEWGAVTLVPCANQDTEQVLEELETAVEAACGVQVVELLESTFPLSGAFPNAAVFDLRRALQALEPREKVVVIGGGLGGPMGVRRILAGVRDQVVSPIVCVQRFAEPLFDVLLRWLEKHTGAQVVRAEDGQRLDVGCVYVASSARDAVKVILREGGPVLQVSASKEPGRFDALLESAAEVYGSRAVGVLLSDHGSDGSEGLLKLRKAGGFTIVQDRASSLVYDLPGRARDAGGAIECLPINEIAERIHMLMRPEHAARS